ncbi:TolC family protein [Echinicola sp. 20G]|uniref:TolC family protein n=1 Tax=Echinicola sp. 20G TaxID=2781961 RepID=UPI00190FDC13|nr:TolC family protein [Echinicola sp. 20G]
MKNLSLIGIVFIGITISPFSCKVKEPPALEELQEQAFANFILPSTWQQAQESQSDSTLFNENWLIEFSNPTLDTLVGEALEYNLDLSVGESRLSQAEGYVKMAKSALSPALNILARENSKLGGDFGGGLNGAIFSAAWEFDIWGKLRNTKHAQIQEYEAAAMELSFARLSIAAAVVRNYYLAIEIYLEKELAMEMLDLSEQLVQIADKRFQVGIGNEKDLVIAKANLTNIKDGFSLLELAYSNQIRALELLLGRYPSSLISIEGDLMEINSIIPAGIPLQILERRPDVLAAQHRFNASFHRVRSAKAARLPQISLTGGFGAVNSNIFTLVPEFSNPIRSLGGSLVAPIYQGGILKENLEVKTYEQEQAVHEYAQTVLSAINDVESTLETVQTVDQRERILKEEVQQNQKAYELQEISYKVGKSDLRDLTLQQMDLYTSQITLLRVQTEKIVQRVNLYLVLGGSM